MKRPARSAVGGLLFRCFVGALIGGVITTASIAQHWETGISGILGQYSQMDIFAIVLSVVVVAAIPLATGSDAVARLNWSQSGFVRYGAFTGVALIFGTHFAGIVFSDFPRDHISAGICMGVAVILGCLAGARNIGRKVEHNIGRKVER